MLPRLSHFAWLFVTFVFVITEIRADTEPKVEVEARGPLHEAFAQPWQKDAAANQPIDQKPPDPIAEEPPDEKPAGDNVQWIPGYWQWDDEKKDFLWISGFWRDVPSGRRWVMGFWSETPEGWRWVNGHWAAEPEQEYQYVPPPPQSLDIGPSTPAPDDESFYIPGTWFYTNNGYRWRAGYWAAYRPGYLWSPARYIWSPRGYYFASGYWDRALVNRGLLFAPVYFSSRAWLTPGWSYRPTFTISAGLAFNSFFFRAGFGHYYFGDFYGPRYAGVGYQPWVHFGARQYDPLFAYERWNNRGNAQWLNSMRQTYDARAAGRQPVPPRTLADQQRLPSGAKSLALVNSVDQLRQSGQRFERVSTQQRTTQIQNVQQIVARSQEQTRTSAKISNGALPPYQPPQRSVQRSNGAAATAGNGGQLRSGGAPLPDSSRSRSLVPGQRTTQPVNPPPSAPKAQLPRSGPASGAAPRSSGPPVSAPSIGGGGRPSAPSIGGGGSRPSAPSIGGGGSRPSAPSIGGGGSRPSAPSIGGGGSRPSAPSIGGGGRPSMPSSGGGGRPSAPSGGSGGGGRPGGKR